MIISNTAQGPFSKFAVGAAWARRAVAAASRETARGVRSARTWGVLIVMMLVCLALTLWPGGWSHSADEAAQDSIRLARPLIKIYDLDTARSLFGCPLRIVIMAVALLYLTPLLTLVLSFGSTERALERSRSNVGPAAMRQAALAEAVTTTMLYGALVVVVHAAAWAVGMATGGVSLATMLIYEGLLVVATVALAAGCVPLWCLLNRLASRRRWLGLAAGFAVAIAFGIVRGALHRRGAMPLADLLPGSLDGVVLAGHASRVAIVPAVIGFWNVALLLGAGRLRSYDKTRRRTDEPTVAGGVGETGRRGLT